MHAIHFDRRPQLAALAALVVALVFAVLLAAAPSIDLSRGGASSAGSTEPAALVGADPRATTPVWVRDPLAPPALVR